LFQEKEKR